MTKSILCADPSAGARRVVRSLILARFGSRIDYLEASHGAEAVVKAASVQPDVVILDIALPRLNGFEAARYIVESSPDTAILALSNYELEAIVPFAGKRGIRAFVSKAALESDLIPALEALLDEKTYLPNEIIDGAIARNSRHCRAAAGQE